jgi:hypothetical protein
MRRAQRNAAIFFILGGLLTATACGGTADVGDLGKGTSSGGSGSGSGSSSSSSGSSSGGPIDAGADVSGSDSSLRDVVADGVSCLLNIPGSCPDCATQNPADQPLCRQYIQCFIAQDCNPNTACGANDGICGVNKIGGGAAPYQAAVATYDCACP